MLYDKIGTDESIITTVYRYAIIAKIFGVKIDDDIQLLPEKTINDIRVEDYNPGIDKLAVLFGAGFIDEKTFGYIARNSASYFDDVTAAEEKIISQNGFDEEDKYTPNMIRNAILCAVNSKKYPQMQIVTFEEALSAAELPHAAVRDGFLKIKDKEFFRFLVEIGEPIGYITKSDEIYIEAAENLFLLSDEDDFEPLADSSPFVINALNVIRISKHYDKLYGKDFILYAKQEDLPITAENYNTYLENIKLTFDIRSYARKRNICGATANWFDYSDTKSNSEDLPYDYEKTIRLDVSENYDEAELLKKAVDKFRSIYTLSDKTMIEIFHASEKKLYLVSGEDLLSVNSDTFHRQLFDFNKIWGIIQECSRNGGLRRQGDRIIIPQEMWEEIAPEEREYADRLIRAQYAIICERRKSNKILQSLGELKAAAAAEKSRKEAEDKEAAQKRQEYMDKLKKRKPETED